MLVARLALVVLALILATAGLAYPGDGAATGATPAAGIFAYATHSGDIWVVDADGSGARQITHSGAGFDFDPAWSPDGTHIAFQTTRGARAPYGETNIFVIRSDGSGERQLTRPSNFLYGGSSPDWSPDGTRLAFGSGRGLALASPNGGPVRLVGVPGDAPVWSPNGSKIAYAAPTGTAQPPNQDVYVISVVSTSAKPRRLTTQPGLDFPGAWSPDGKRLAYLVQEHGSGHIVIAGADGSRPTTVTRGVGTQFPADWTSDGRLLVGISKPRQRTPTWYLMRPDGSQLQHLPQLEAAVVATWHE
jgi:Tol biopolymer transport system component